MKTDSLPMAPHIVKETVDELAAGFAEAADMGSPAEKMGAMLAAMVNKCVQCKADSVGRIGLNALADCSETDCPLNAYGPSIFECIRAKLHAGRYPAGAVQ